MDNTQKLAFKESLKKMWKSDAFKAIAVLCIIALMSALILSVVHRYTIVDEEAVLREKVGEVYPSSPVTTSVDVSSYRNIDNSVILNAFVAEDGAYIILSKSKKAYNSGTGITLIVVIKEGIILCVQNYLSSETPGLGTRALKESYLSQYVGVEANALAVRDQVEIRDPNEQTVKIEYIGGATKSSPGVRISVTAAATFYIREAAK
jgi:Na+-translocating ferredoxin:NAD+ oxidoreductase RnfG subunit